MKNKTILIIILSLVFLGVIIVLKGKGGKPEIPKTNLDTNMKITSSAFLNGEMIPEKYTCDGENINPPLEFSEIPPQTKSLALIMDDPDSPSGKFVHWIIWNINPETLKINENSIPENTTEGTNSFGNNGYGGPCPGSGEHRYIFKLYALDKIIDLDTGTKADALKKKIKGHILDQAELMGGYKRK